MTRCVYLHSDGSQCISDALENADFCGEHAYETDVTALEEHPFRKLVLRLIALILLLLLLIPYYRFLQSVNMAPGIEAGESG